MSERLKNWLVFGLLVGTAAYGIAEEITMSTYYPSPRGVYNELRTVGSAFLATQGGSVGIGTATPAAGVALDVNGTLAAAGLRCPDCVDSAALQANGAVAGTYGSAAEVPQVTVDEDGRVTSATNVPVAVEIKHVGCTWTTWFSEEGPNNFRNCPAGRYVAGVKCGDQYCDNLQLNCCALQ
jgi:hypothetical protein